MLHPGPSLLPPPLLGSQSPALIYLFRLGAPPQRPSWTRRAEPRPLPPLLFCLPPPSGTPPSATASGLLPATSGGRTRASSAPAPFARLPRTRRNPSGQQSAVPSCPLSRGPPGFTSKAFIAISSPPTSVPRPSRTWRKPTLAPQISARPELRGTPPSYSAVFAAVRSDRQKSF